MAAVTYNTEDLIGGEIKTDQAPLAADTYFRGMPLKYTAGSDYYEYDSGVLSTVAIYLGDDKAASTGTVVSSDEDKDTILMGGEIMEEGIVDDSGDAITITQDMIAACAANGLYIKRS